LRVVVFAAAAALTAAFSHAARAQDPPPPTTPPVAAPTAPQVIPVNRIVAVVDRTPILQSEVELKIEEWRDMRRPGMPADQNAAFLFVLDELINVQLLLKEARNFNITVPDEEIASTVDDFIKQVRDQNFGGNDATFRAELAKSQYKSLEGFRASRMEEERRQRLQRLAVDSLKARGRLPTVAISEKEIEQAFEEVRRTRPETGPTVAFRQIVVKIEAKPAEHVRAQARAESLLVVLRAGASFDSIARRFSADSATAVKGGDLDWFRRGAFVPEFEQAAFALRPGTLSSVIKTEHGYHIIRVDRVRPGEVRARHVLIRPVRDSTDVARTLALAGEIAAALRAGANFDSLSTLHHDPVEDRILADPIPVAEMPEAYQKALTGVDSGQVTAPFEIGSDSGVVHKVAVVQVLARAATGRPMLAQYRERIRDSLKEAKSMERLLETLRRETHVEIRLGKTDRASQ
jgi:peptidyl-prolyl cis-trans isomerase SurA